ncbi:hypothetical protein MYA_5223 [Burkholderia sp. KJ006]|nr:hypothetical protein MYA_5223 [Burkholderia sp. KJ006]
MRPDRKVADVCRSGEIVHRRADLSLSPRRDRSSGRPVLNFFNQGARGVRAAVCQRGSAASGRAH